MATARFSEIDPSEKLALTFDFTAGLAVGESIVSADRVITVDSGKDALSDTRFANPVVTSPKVIVVVSDALAGVDYHVKVVAVTTNSNKILALARVLPVRAA